MNNENGVGTRAAQLAQLAAKAAKIAAAAGTGGPYGAAGEAVRQFLPQIIKIGSVLLIVLLLLPMLIFNAIPHLFFGWEGNDSADIAAITEKAAEAGGFYNRFEEILQEEINNVIAQGSTEGAETYINTQNADVSWLIAIISVYYQQDLTQVNEAAVREIIAAALGYTEQEGENDTWQLNIHYIDADALMSKLNFSQEQRNWAELLYSNLTDVQMADTGELSQNGGANNQTPNLSHEPAGFVYYNQKDPRWAEQKYGQTGTIGRSGCGPTALAMAVSTLSGKTVTPPDVAGWSYRNGYYVEGVGSKHALIPDGAKHYGIKTESVRRQDKEKIIKALSEGKLIVALMTKGHFTSSGHFIVLCGVTAEGKILVADPNSTQRSNQAWDLDLILNETNPNAGAGGPLWIMS